MSRFNPRAFQNAQLEAAARPASSIDAAPVHVTRSPERAFIAAYGRPDAAKVTVPEGTIALTLCLKYNDSAPQVDHFDYHAHLGCPAFLLLLAKKQAQTEALARKALSLCPELQDLDWQWKTERYVGGHGNYLISSPVKLPGSFANVLTARHTFGGQPVTAPFWEIQFTQSGRGHTLELWPHKHYGNQPLPDSLITSAEAATGPITVTWCLNDRHAGVEIHFSRRPDDAALAPLRADRAWRYTGHSKCWYARQAPDTLAFAKNFCDQFNGVVPVAVTPPSPRVTATPPSPAPIVVPQVPPMPGMTVLGLRSTPVAVTPSPTPVRPERKIIRYTPSPSPIVAVTVTPAGSAGAAHPGGDEATNL